MMINDDDDSDDDDDDKDDDDRDNDSDDNSDIDSDNDDNDKLTFAVCCRFKTVGSNNVVIVVCKSFNIYTVATSSIFVPCI